MANYSWDPISLAQSASETLACSYRTLEFLVFVTLTCTTAALLLADGCAPYGAEYKQIHTDIFVVDHTKPDVSLVVAWATNCEILILFRAWYHSLT